MKKILAGIILSPLAPFLLAILIIAGIGHLFFWAVETLFPGIKEDDHGAFC